MAVWPRSFGILAGLGAVVLVNQVRIALIAFATQQWGMDLGYEVAHRFAGSLLAIVGFALSLLVVIKVLGGGRPSRLSS